MNPVGAKSRPHIDPVAPKPLLCSAYTRRSPFWAFLETTLPRIDSALFVDGFAMSESNKKATETA